jgi:hypothetical protein
MLSKRYQRDLPNVVKANVPVNFLLPDLVALDPEAQAIFLHCSLSDYLLAILRSDNHRKWLANVTRQLSGYLGDLSPLSDAERCAALWLAQMQAFAAAIAGLPNSRSLDSEAFFNAPWRFVALSAAQLNVSMTEPELDALIAGPLFSTYSKNPDLPFDNEARLARRAEMQRSLAAEIDEAHQWMAARSQEAERALAAIASVKLGD